ncbi:dTDP-4-dehydrorhamnose reductase [Clostridium hydrogeniformans]|uniref:dTDP-4-dehydrorhamnose reductase n=1 Tax=Clostridium hydrogeniformans TaxID=349933 RepID=UPI00048946BB|nr:dTDP-4-dehydrorhamnose reductase [Clostridium hydrogeniformans]
MKILITGAKGQLGSAITNILSTGICEIGEISNLAKNVEVIACGSEELDITHLNKVKEVIKNEKPQIVINCAAYTNVDGCETDYDGAFKVNALGPRNLAIGCEEIGAKLIHISTDYVFKGDGSSPYKECDITNPISAYGKTKLLGEDYVREFCSRYFVVRTSWVYGYDGKNFVKTIIKAAKERGHLTVVDDQRGNPTNAEDLAYHIIKLMETEEYGVYNCTGEGECSWYDFAKAIVKFSEIDCTVEPITSDKLDRAAKRPAFSSLDNMMLRCTIGNHMRPWEKALETFINKLN